MIYLDYAASAPVYDDVCALTVRLMTESYANPSSLHAAGIDARRLLRQSRQRAAALLGFAPEGVIFTSGGTESNNTALMSVRSGARRNIVIAATEHHSVLNAAAEMKKLGFSVTEVYPDPCGVISPEAIEKALSRDTVLLSVHAVNNETGTVQDIAAMAELAHGVGALYHCDAVQAFGHVLLPFDRADLVSLSAHKFGGPRGVGILAAKPNALSTPLIFGGRQEFNLRAGTENLPAIAGCALAMENARRELEAEQKRISALSELLLSALRKKLPEIALNCGDALRVPNILSLRIPGISAMELVTRLSEKGICIGAGAACTLGDSSPSHVLTAMGMDAKSARETVRISFGRLTTEEDILSAAREIANICK